MTISGARLTRTRSSPSGLQHRSYAKQTLEITRMRGMLEDESDAKRKAMMKEIQLENQRLV